MDSYSEAHLFVAAIRLAEHHSGGAAKIDEVCSILRISSEAGHALCRKLDKSGIISIVEDPFSLRLLVADHLRIEHLPKEQGNQDSLAKEIEQFQAKKQNMDKKVEAIQAELERKRKAMFSDIEEKLKKEMGRKNE